MNNSELIKAALDARKFSYSPYSGFAVGAALLCKDGSLYTGCNIESASYTPTICAERTAVFKAVSEGERDFAMLAIVGGKGDEIAPATPPCGVCRQVLAEFCSKDFPILLVKGANDYDTCTLGELLPYAFGPGMLLD